MNLIVLSALDWRQEEKKGEGHMIHLMHNKQHEPLSGEASSSLNSEGI